ncbi:MAG: hypothetical protein H6Q32_684 [Bacteroidetes bacterium]|nr:hypothetical protein [Bacteroidota bacterium]
MKSFRILLICLLAVLLVAQTGVAQNRKAGLTGASFLKVGVGARNVALGTAVTALSGDVTQMFYNPAGIALKDQTLQASFTYNKWIADIGHSAAAVSYNIEGIGTIGVGFITFGLSGIEATRDIPVDPGLRQFQIDNNTNSTYDYRDIAYQLTISRYVMDALSLGITVKGISQTIDGEGATAFAVDFGSVYDIGVLDWKIAARFNNLGSDLLFYDIASPLPMQFTIGTSLVPFKNDMMGVMVAVDAAKPQDGPLYIYSGVEVRVTNMVALRGGYKFNYSGTDEVPGTGLSAVNSTIEGLSAGAGLRTSLEGYEVGFDYSFTQMDLLDPAHRFTLTVGLK